jgi:hypothetical protein
MKRWYSCILILSLLLLICSPPVSADSGAIGGDQGWYVIHCNVQGANVYLDDKFVGTVPTATLTVPASTTGTPYKTLSVKKYGYSTFVSSIAQVPGKGESIDLYATLNNLPGTTQTSVGGDVGWYVVHCNIDGAHVQFDGSDKGDISSGLVYVPVYSSGTPYQEFTVTKEGYTPFKGYIGQVPGKGESVDLYATLNPAVAAITTTGTSAVIGGDTGYYAVYSNVDGAEVSFDNEVKGQIYKGNLVVQVYVTGTPFKTFTVYKAGYVPFTGTIDQYPKKGETIDLNATLKPGAAGTTAIPVSPTQKSALPVEVCGFALVLASAGIVLSSRK